MNHGFIFGAGMVALYILMGAISVFFGWPLLDVIFTYWLGT